MHLYDIDYVRVHLPVSSRFKRPKGVSAMRARGVLMVKILNKCILSILVYNLFLKRQRNILYTPQYFHTSVYWLYFWNRNLIIRLSDWGKNSLDPKIQMNHSCWNSLDNAFIYCLYHWLFYVIIVFNHSGHNQVRHYAAWLNTLILKLSNMASK